LHRHSASSPTKLKDILQLADPLCCRLEKDAVDWARILGGIKKYLAEYARSFAAAGFSKRKDLYIASGLLSYNASLEMKDMLTFLEPHSR
jgi:hypothetical protein